MQRMPVEKADEQMLAFITAYSEENGIAPTYRQIAAAMGWRSTSTVKEHINSLVEQEKLVLHHDGRRNTIAIRRNASTTTKRADLILADGGSIAFDYITSSDVEISFCGILDASRLKNPVSEIVTHHIEE